MYNKGKYYFENILFKLYTVMCVNTNNVKCLSYCELQLKKKNPELKVMIKSIPLGDVPPSSW